MLLVCLEGDKKGRKISFGLDYWTSLTTFYSNRMPVVHAHRTVVAFFLIQDAAFGGVGIAFIV